MKKVLISLIALVGLSVSGLAFADGLGTGLSTTQSPHNFADNWCGGSAAGGGADCSTLTVPIGLVGRLEPSVDRPNKRPDPTPEQPVSPTDLG